MQIDPDMQIDPVMPIDINKISKKYLMYNEDATYTIDDLYNINNVFFYSAEDIEFRLNRIIHSKDKIIHSRDLTMYDLIQHWLIGAWTGAFNYQIKSNYPNLFNIEAWIKDDICDHPKFIDEKLAINIYKNNIELYKEDYMKLYNYLIEYPKCKINYNIILYRWSSEEIIHEIGQIYYFPTMIGAALMLTTLKSFSNELRTESKSIENTCCIYKIYYRKNYPIILSIEEAVLPPFQYKVIYISIHETTGKKIVHIQPLKILNITWEDNHIHTTGYVDYNKDKYITDYCGIYYKFIKSIMYLYKLSYLNRYISKYKELSGNDTINIDDINSHFINMKTDSLSEIVIEALGDMHSLKDLYKDIINTAINWIKIQSNLSKLMEYYLVNRSSSLDSNSIFTKLCIERKKLENISGWTDWDGWTE